MPSAKPLGYYLPTYNDALVSLESRYGSNFQTISAQQKMLMVSAIADHMASNHDSYPMQSSIESADPDNLLGDALKFLLCEIADVSDAAELNSLILAIVENHADDIRAGAYD